MGSFRSKVGWGVAVALALTAQASFLVAQAKAPEEAPRKSVYGKLETVDASLNGVIIRSDAGERLAWRFDRRVIKRLEEFKPGDAVIVIYRQTLVNEKSVTAIAFPGKADSPIYVNATGQRVTVRSAPMMDGVCGRPEAAPVSESVVPIDGAAEVLEACWCCTTSGATCTPGNKSGNGRAILIACFQ